MTYAGWQQIVDAINSEYEAANGVPCPWGNKLAFARLRTLVRGNPKWTAEMWVRCVRHLFASDDVNLAAPPELLIPKLPCYIHGPLNKFHEVKRAAYNPATEGMRREPPKPVEFTPEEAAAFAQYKQEQRQKQEQANNPTQSGEPRGDSDDAKDLSAGGMRQSGSRPAAVLRPGVREHGQAGEDAQPAGQGRAEADRTVRQVLDAQPAGEGLREGNAGDRQLGERGVLVRSSVPGDPQTVSRGADPALAAEIGKTAEGKPEKAQAPVIDRTPYKNFPESDCAQCRQGFPVSHNGSRGCRSGSIASGGDRAHCSCSTCW